MIQESYNKARLGAALTKKMRQDMELAGASQGDIEARITRSLNRLEQAPLAILLCRDTAAVKSLEREEISMAVQSVALAGLQILLAAHAEGLGGVWICWPLYAPSETKTALALPESWEPQGMLFIGYPDDTPQPREKITTEEVTLYR